MRILYRGYLKHLCLCIETGASINSMNPASLNKYVLHECLCHYAWHSFCQIKCCRRWCLEHAPLYATLELHCTEGNLVCICLHETWRQIAVFYSGYILGVLVKQTGTWWQWQHRYWVHCQPQARVVPYFPAKAWFVLNCHVCPLSAACAARPQDFFYPMMLRQICGTVFSLDGGYAWVPAWC